MKPKKLFISIAPILASIIVVGCTGSSDSTLTKAQEDAARHPSAAPGYKGPTPESTAEMQKSIEAFRDQHKNDKVEFNK